MWKFIAICLIVLVFLIAVSNAQVPINNPVKPKVGLSLAFGSKDGFGSEIVLGRTIINLSVLPFLLSKPQGFRPTKLINASRQITLHVCHSRAGAC